LATARSRRRVGPRQRGPIATFVRERRRLLGYTQPELAERTGTGLRFVRELERGKPSLRVDKVNQVLAFFGAELVPATRARATRPEERSP
jgi:y4mF family transcriptional regulator